MQALTLLANDVEHFQHGVLVAPGQPCRCPYADAFRQAPDDLDNLVFVQRHANEPALLIKGFAASWVEATEALHGSRSGFETAELLDFAATA